MPVPSGLDDAVAAAWTQIRAAPNRHIQPVLRQFIYIAFGPATDIVADQARGWIGFLAAQRVLPLWEAAVPGIWAAVKARHDWSDTFFEEQEFDLPRRALAVIKAILETRQARPLTGEYHDVLESYYHWQHGYGVPIPENAWAATQAIYAAQPDTNTFNGFWPGVVINSQTKDADIDRRHGMDAAGWAVRAYAGSATPLKELSPLEIGVKAELKALLGRPATLSKGFSQLDPQRCEAFWTWWLQEAVPEAWRRAQH